MILPIFEGVILIALLYIAYRLLRADWKLMKEKLDAFFEADKKENK